VVLIHAVVNLICEEKDKCNFKEIKEDVKQLILVMQGYGLGKVFEENQTIVTSFNQ